MRTTNCFLTLLTGCLIFSLPVDAEGRTWKDKTGNYTVEGELFAFNDEHVVIERTDGELGMYKIDFLCDEDREYLRSEESAQRSKTHLDGEQSWEMKGGFQLVGTLVDYTRTKVTIQRRRGKLYVNDRLFENLPQVYRTIIVKSLGQYENIADIDQEKFQQWVLAQRNEPRTFQVDGIVMELRDGNEYTIPFVLFSPRSLERLRGGWESWLAAHQSDNYDARDDESFRLQATAAEIIRNQERARQIAIAQLNLDLIRSGITSVWEVSLFPLPGNPAPPRWVMVQAPNSLQATNIALQQHPGFRAGPVRRIR